MNLSRRALLQSGLATLAAPALAQARPHVVVVGGGFGGAMAARALVAHGIDATLIEPNAIYTACPLSNAVIGGLRSIDAQRFGYDKVAAAGVKRVAHLAQDIDASKRSVLLADGTRLSYDRLIVAPGIDLRFDALPGYSEAASAIMPHAWKAGPQTLLLRQQLEAMPDGGRVVMAIPANPYRCPPGPYERASLIAHYLKTNKPKSKLLLLDAKDSFSKQKLFQSAWDRFYPGLIQWVPLSQGGKLVEVDPVKMEFVTEFGREKADVGNVIPPQRAAIFAQKAGLADRTGWCPVDPVTFESVLIPGVHVIGDAAIMGTMPKSAFSAHVQAQNCVAQMALLLKGSAPQPNKLINTCYSLVTPDYGISVSGVYQVRDGKLADVEGAGGVSAADAPDSDRAAEARYAEAWFDGVTRQTYG